jgi:hypothetical protein
MQRLDELSKGLPGVNKRADDAGVDMAFAGQGGRSYRGVSLNRLTAGRLPIKPDWILSKNTGKSAWEYISFKNMPVLKY